jgi:hypothetical protein
MANKKKALKKQITEALIIKGEQGEQGEKQGKHSNNKNLILGETETEPEVAAPKEENNIEKLINCEMAKFDNKYQASMFYVAYKSLEAVNKLIMKKNNSNLDNEIMEIAITSLIPNIINEYNDNLKKYRKKVNMVTIANELLCMARTLEGKQCTRKRSDGSDLCKPHIAKLVNVRISDTM